MSPRLVPPLVEIAPQHQRANFAVGDAALEHPEPAIGMDVFHAPDAQYLVGVLDVDDAEAKADFGAQFLEYGEFFWRPMRVLHHDMIDMQTVQVIDQLAP